MEKLNLPMANKIIDEVFTEARALSLSPLAVVILDDAGHPIAMQREDGASFLRSHIAMAKAWSAIGMGMPSRALAGLAEERPMFMTALIGVASGNMMPVPGGVLIRSEEHHILGAVGVSGDLSDQDEACAIAGIKAVNLIADAGHLS